ncbi:hypothetical protein DSCO28_37260 [Desulfosarcina ovata subsp. sediminis]|uniref:Uncharacterized protein n=2 Tax=Desulfosarcina ovata TaxID=83564 RepID=A0A5K7ZSH3_9BACT|nr:hypothetical protein DSCO28_37260 [Desulfosarcina ovata subsp. sediminis]
MVSVINYYAGINSVAVIGNYLPRQCGIATFTTDLVEGLSAEAPDINCWAAVVNDKPYGYVPNVVYSCCAIIHNSELVIPCAMSDINSGIATVAVDALFNGIRTVES